MSGIWRWLGRRTPLPRVPREDTGRRFWYGVLNMFPFIFLPLVALFALFAALVMPYLTGVYRF